MIHKSPRPAGIGGRQGHPIVSKEPLSNLVHLHSSRYCDCAAARSTYLRISSPSIQYNYGVTL